MFASGGLVDLGIFVCVCVLCVCVCVCWLWSRLVNDSSLDGLMVTSEKLRSTT